MPRGIQFQGECLAANLDFIKFSVYSGKTQIQIIDIFFEEFGVPISLKQLQRFIFQNNIHKNDQIPYNELQNMVGEISNIVQVNELKFGINLKDIIKSILIIIYLN